MSVISFVNPKGGSGKSTAALLLATELAHSGSKITIIDADPNIPLWSWSQTGEKFGTKPDNITVYVRDVGDSRLKDIPHEYRFNKDDLIDLIERASLETDFVVIDLEGTADDIIGNAVAFSDLVIIPFQLSPMDIEQSIRAIKLVNLESRKTRTKIPFALLFTRDKAILSGGERQLEQKFYEQSDTLPFLKTRLVERSAYKQIVINGGTLYDLDQSNKSITSAIRNARHYAVEIIEWLSKDQTGELSPEREGA